MKHLGLCLIILLFINSPVCALTPKAIKEEASKIIQDYVLEKNPEFKDALIIISFKYADKTWGALSGIPQKFTLKILELYPDFNPVGNTIVPIGVYVDSKLEEKMFLRTKVEVFKNVLVAARPLRKKEIIDEGSIEFAEKDIAILPKSPFYDKKLLVGKQLTATMGKGVVLLPWMVRVPPTVSKDSFVTIIARKENISISTKGIALEDGYTGGVIKVRNADSKKEILGRILAEGEVEVAIH